MSKLSLYKGMNTSCIHFQCILSLTTRSIRLLQALPAVSHSIRWWNEVWSEMDWIGYSRGKNSVLLLKINSQNEYFI